MARRSHRSRLDQWRALRLSSLLLFSALLGGVALTLADNLMMLHESGTKQVRGDSRMTEIIQHADPLALSRSLRGDRLDLSYALQSNRAAKGSIAGESSRSTANLPESQAKFAAEALFDARENGAMQGKNDFTANVKAEIGLSLNTSRRLPASISRDPETGELSIGDFEAMSFPGEAGSCREIGETIMHELASPKDLQVVAETELISVMRICASNGSVILSCRNGGVTISPRRLRPNDGCSGEKA